jgi:hypothetical protein
VPPDRKEDEVDEEGRENVSGSDIDDAAAEAQRLLRVVEPGAETGTETAALTPDSDETHSAKPGAQPRRRRAARLTKRNRKSKARSAAKAGPRQRVARAFPASTFEEALELPLAIQRISAGTKVRRLTLFEQLDKSPESGPSRQMITNSARYGLTTGSYKAEYLELTQLGRTATSAETPERERLRARFELAINRIEPFRLLYETLHDKRLPTHAVMRDVLAEAKYPEDQLQECVDTFVVNAKFVGLLRTIAGSERVISIQQLLEEHPERTPPEFPAVSEASPVEEAGGAGDYDWSKICFYVAPIGEPESEARQHSDLILASLVEPALAELDLKVVRADAIETPGVITKQVIEHVAKARLVVADLSFHNPNVFYELAFRHATRKPVVHLIRAFDPIPFDLDQFRTIKIDTSGLYSFVPQIETYRAEIASHARRALEEPADAGPLSVFYPEFRSLLPNAA